MTPAEKMAADLQAIADEDAAAEREFRPSRSMEDLNMRRLVNVLDSGNPKKALNTKDYRNALHGEGPMASQWEDKPHRLVFDLCSEVERLQAAMRLIDHNAKCDWCADIAKGVLP